MASSILSLIALALAALSFLAPARGGGYIGPRVGGRTPVPDVGSNKEVQDLGRYSVHEYNRMQRHQRGGGGGNGEIMFGEVVRAERQVVAGIKYYLSIEGVQGGARKVFESVVVVRPWVRSKELLTFGPSRGGEDGGGKSGF